MAGVFCLCVVEYFAPMTEKSELQLLCEKLEHWETPEWAAKAILSKEILSGQVYDPCVGIGVIAHAVNDAGHGVIASDIHDWGYNATYQQDFLTVGRDAQFFSGLRGQTAIFNPPFSVSEKFVDKAFELGARKVVCFQKFSWYEGSYDTGKKRGQWWEARRPSRIWICGDRADCWRHDIPKHKRTSSTPTAYAWFVWERGHAPAAITGHIYKRDAA